MLKVYKWFNMKYLITESQRDKMVFKYLNLLDLYMIEHKGDYIFWTSEEAWRSGDYSNVLISAHRRHNDCFISSDLLEQVSSFFSFELKESLDIIGEWVKSKVDFDINYFYSDSESV